MEHALMIEQNEGSETDLCRRSDAWVDR